MERSGISAGLIGIFLVVLVAGAILGYFVVGVKLGGGSSTSTSKTSTPSQLPTSNTSILSTLGSTRQSNLSNESQVQMVGGQGSFSFYPNKLTVVIGVNNTVIWVNSNTVAHTVTATNQSFNSGNMDPGAVFKHVFTTAGVYTYYCLYHSLMKGTVTVVSRG